MTTRLSMMTNRIGICAVALLCVLGAAMPVHAKSGIDVYDSTCLLCHALVTKPRSGYSTGTKFAVVTPRGPTLSNIFGRPAGIIANYRYSKGMKAFAKTGAVWNRETLDKYLTDSRAFVNGTFMILKLEPDDRKLVLDYLEQVAPYKP